MRGLRFHIILESHFWRIFGMILMLPFFHTVTCAQDYSNGLLDRSHVLDMAKNISMAQYPDADVVYVDSHQWIKYQKDGTYEEWDDSYVKILSEKGRRMYTQVMSYFTIPYNTTKFTLVEIIQSDGQTRVIDIQKNSQTAIDRSQMNSNIYNPNNKIVFINIPNLNIGDVLHYVIYDHFSKVRVPNTWSDYVPLEKSNPIHRMMFTIIAPKEKPLVHIVIKSEIPNTVTFNQTNNDKTIQYQWIVKDVPMAFPEPQMPPLYTQTQRLLVSTIKNWRDISKWYWKLCRPNINQTTPEMIKTVEQLTHPHTEDIEKIKAIFFWVSQEIRYLGLTVEEDTPGYEPHPVKMTFERRSGVCRDKAALLSAMLRLAGFNAYPVLIMNGPKKDTEIPQPWFNHAITAVKQKDNSFLLMDATDENTRELFPSYLNDQSFLVASETGETLHTSPTDPAINNLLRIETIGKINSEGQLNATTTLNFEGINDNVYRSYFANNSKNEQHEYFEKLVKRVVSNARLLSYQITPEDMLDTSQSLKAKLTIETNDIRVMGKDTIMIPLIRFGANIGIVRHILGSMGLKKRKYPIRIYSTCGIQEQITLDVSQSVGDIISLPEYESITKNNIDWSRDVSVVENQLTMKSQFLLNQIEYSPNQYAFLRQSLKTIEIQNKKMPIFFKPMNQKTSAWYGEADALILEENVTFDVQDTSTWQETFETKIQILTYAGKKEHSDILINYNPSWDHVEIVEASVTSASGDTIPINDQEMNIMDATWSGEAPRYPPGKTLVMNLPGVEIGSTIYYKITHRKTNRPFFSINGAYFAQENQYMPMKKEKNNLSANGIFRTHEPILKKQLTIRTPRHIKMSIIQSNCGIGQETRCYPKDQDNSSPIIHYQPSENDNMIMHFFFANKIKHVKKEAFLPPWYTFNPIICASTGQWQPFATQLNNRLIQLANNQLETNKKAQELIQSSTDDLSNIQTIRDFVAIKIRRVNVPFYELPLETLTPADKTLKDGYGHSADKAIVLYALLKEAGFKPQFVLVSSFGPKINQLQKAMAQIPLMEWFDMVLVRLNINDTWYYLNDTDQYAWIGTTASEFSPALDLNQGQFTKVMPSTLNYQTQNKTNYSIQLLSNGTALINQTIQYYGMNYSLFKKQCQEMTPETRERYHQEQIALISQSAIAASPYTTTYDLYPAIESFSVTVPDYAINQKDWLYFQAIGITEGIQGVSRDYREVPLFRNWYSKQQTHIEILFPRIAWTFHAMPPDSLKVRIPGGGSIALTSTFNAPVNQLVIEQNIDIPPLIVYPEFYPALLNAHHQISHPQNKTILLSIEKNDDK